VIVAKTSLPPEASAVTEDGGYRFRVRDASVARE
jgi:hypothetical protein